MYTVNQIFKFADDTYLVVPAGASELVTRHYDEL